MRAGGWGGTRRCEECPLIAWNPQNFPGTQSRFALRTLPNSVVTHLLAPMQLTQQPRTSLAGPDSEQKSQLVLSEAKKKSERENVLLDLYIHMFIVYHPVPRTKKLNKFRCTKLSFINTFGLLSKQIICI